MNTTFNTEKHRIVFYSDCPFFGGCENVLVNIFNCKAITDQYEIYFFYRYRKKYQEGLEKKLNQTAVKLRPLKLYPEYSDAECRITSGLAGKLLKKTISFLERSNFFMLVNIRIIASAFREIGEIDLLHINNGGYPAALSCLSAVFAGKMAGAKKILFHVNNLASPYDPLFSVIQKYVDQRIVKIVDYFITGSIATGNYLAEKRKFPRKKILNIYNAIPRPFESSQIEEYKNFIRQEFNVSGEKTIIGSIGKLEWNKGFDVLIEAVRILETRNYKDIILFIFGEGSDKDALERTIVENFLEDKIKLPGYKYNILKYLCGIDMFVLPSLWYEDCPYVIIEAMALEKPVIATKIAGIPEQIDHSVNGFLVDPDDPEAIADHLEILIKDQVAARKMGLEGLRKFYSMYKYEVVMKRYIELYTRLIKREESNET